MPERSFSAVAIVVEIARLGSQIYFVNPPSMDMFCLSPEKKVSPKNWGPLSGALIRRILSYWSLFWPPPTIYGSRPIRTQNDRGVRRKPSTRMEAVPRASESP